VGEPFEAPLDRVLALDVLHVSIELISISILGSVQAKARAATEVALQGAAPAIDKVDESGCVHHPVGIGHGLKVRTGLHRNRHRSVFEYDEVMQDERLIHSRRNDVVSLEMQPARKLADEVISDR